MEIALLEGGFERNDDVTTIGCSRIAGYVSGISEETDLTVGSQVGAESPAVMVVTIIVGVSVTTAILGWIMWRAWKSAERAETDLRHRRRTFLRLGLIYVAAAVIGVAGVLRGTEPKESLVGLPIGVLLAWFWLRTALKVKVPPIVDENRR